MRLSKGIEVNCSNTVLLIPLLLVYVFKHIYQICSPFKLDTLPY